MSTKAVLGLLGAVIVIGGGAWYFSSKGITTNLSGTPEEEETATGGTFAELVGRAGSWRCEVSTSIENAPSEGVAHIADGKVRADFTTMMDGQSVTSHMIHADGYVYTWSDAYPQGMKMLVPEGGPHGADASPGISYDARVDYDCAVWATDASLFTPPSTVTFMELGADGMPSYPLPQ